jgi:riboflavin biosynthesis pyrimidine reductase
VNQTLSTIRTLIDRSEAAAHPTLPEELRMAYGGDLWFPPSHPERPYVAGNFVSTLDGVVSYRMAGKSGGGDISGFDPSDRFIMGLLRASADAVMMGSGTLQETAPDHLFVADRVYPEARELYARYRSEVLRKKSPPLHVVVSGSGRMDLSRAVFRTPGIQTLIVTTKAGGEFLAASGAGSLVSTMVRMFEGPNIAPASILELLRGEFGISLLLHEGGPTLFGQFLAAGCVDELFLTIAPQVAGRDMPPPRPGFVSGVEFTPDRAPWLELVSVKQTGSHLYLRYSRDGAAPGRPGKPRRPQAG